MGFPKHRIRGSEASNLGLLSRTLWRNDCRYSRNPKKGHLIVGNRASPLSSGSLEHDMPVTGACRRDLSSYDQQQFDSVARMVAAVLSRRNVTRQLV